MKNVIPYTKEIIFKSNIGEISSISLEHEEEVVGNSIEGIFKVSGEYKTHEISVNKEDFSYDLPFNIELDENIDTNSLSVDIEDFNYSFASDVLKVNIEFSITGERKKEETEDDKIEKNDADERSDSDERNEVVFDESILEKINEIENKEKEMKEEIKQVKEDKNEQQEQQKVEKEQKGQQTDQEEIKEVEEVEEKSIEEQEYITYHVHIIKEEETVESICKMYGTMENLVSEYNDLANIKTGDKLIIPEVQDE